MMLFMVSASLSKSPCSTDEDRLVSGASRAVVEKTMSATAWRPPMPKKRMRSRSDFRLISRPTSSVLVSSSSAARTRYRSDLPYAGTDGSLRSTSSRIVYIVNALTGLFLPMIGIRCFLKSALVAAGARKCSDCTLIGGVPAGTFWLVSNGRKWAWKIAPALWPMACSSRCPDSARQRSAVSLATSAAPPVLRTALAALSFIDPQIGRPPRRMPRSIAASAMSLTPSSPGRRPTMPPSRSASVSRMPVSQTK